MPRDTPSLRDFTGPYKYCIFLNELGALISAQEKAGSRRLDYYILTLTNYFTSTTQFCVPKEFATQEAQRGSFVHTPSTKNLYSCLPGLRFVFTSQLPLESHFASSFLASQPLKEPAKFTFLAFGA
jgi:hypothetical protein